MDREPVLYVLMRTDLASMNPGKACAQATHAANQCVAQGRDVAKLLEEWAADRGFGTCIVLGVPGPEMMVEAVHAARAAGVHAGVTHDPSYPLRDGNFTHLIPLDTCAYLFGERFAVAPLVSGLELLP